MKTSKLDRTRKAREGERGREREAVCTILVPAVKSPLTGPKRDHFFPKQGPKRDHILSKKGPFEP